MPNLEFLYMDRCVRIEDLSDSVFEKIEKIKLISLPPNLKEVPQQIRNIKTLRILNMGACVHIQYLPSFIEKMPLHKLILPPNLEAISGDIISNKKFIKLDMSQCVKITTLPKFINTENKESKLGFVLPPNLIKIPKEMTEMENLASLDMSHCLLIKTLPDGIANLKKLITLILPPNLTEFDDSQVPLASEYFTCLDMGACVLIRNIGEHTKEAPRTNAAQSKRPAKASKNYLGSLFFKHFVLPPDLEEFVMFNFLRYVGGVSCLDLSRCRYIQNLSRLLEKSHILSRIEKLVLPEKFDFPQMKEDVIFFGDTKKLRTLDVSHCIRWVPLPQAVEKKGIKVKGFEYTDIRYHNLREKKMIMNNDPPSDDDDDDYGYSDMMTRTSSNMAEIQEIRDD